jgi:hypothetical protein
LGMIGKLSDAVSGGFQWDRQVRTNFRYFEAPPFGLRPILNEQAMRASDAELTPRTY